MSSTVACIGFTDPTALAAIVREQGEQYHELSSTTKWVDDSGAMLLLDRAAQYARPAYATRVRTPYRSITPLENGLAQVTLTDISGYELAPFTVVPNNRYTVGWAPVGRVGLVAMGVDTEFFATAEDFFDSPRSSLPGFEGEPPAEVRQFNLPWPPSMEIETFMPGESTDTPLATMSGTVQFAEVQRNSMTGHEFLVSRIATVCGEVDLCTPVPVEGAPQPGAVVVGQVELLAAFPAFGEDESAAVDAVEAPSERIAPRSRQVEPEAESDEPSPEILAAREQEPELPDGLVLGDDGIVRTADEHAAWKGGDEDAGSRPTNLTGGAEQGVDSEAFEAPDGRRELPPEPAPTEVSVEHDGLLGTDAPAPSTAAGDAAAHHPADAPVSLSSEDDAPRPGETRREWRERTGR